MKLMSEWYDNVSAEVVLREPRRSSKERKCLDGCLNKLKPQERELVLRFFGDKKMGPKDLGSSLVISGVQLKKISSRLKKCIENCLNESEENGLR